MSVRERSAELFTTLDLRGVSRANVAMAQARARVAQQRLRARRRRWWWSVARTFLLLLWTAAALAAGYLLGLVQNLEQELVR